MEPRPLTFPFFQAPTLLESPDTPAEVVVMEAGLAARMRCGIIGERR